MASNCLRFTASVAQTGAREILKRDRARAQKLIAGIQPHGPLASQTAPAPGGGSDAEGETIDVTDAAVTYTAQVGVGSPATEYTLLIDTGSSNTWVGAATKYKQTSTSKNTGKKVTVSYGSGSFSGTEWTDQVTLGSDLVIQNQSIGVASTAQGFNDVDGILGIGPVDLTEGTVGGQTPVPTVTDNLFQQGTISVESIGIFYQPTTSSDASANGELTFGGVDETKTTGDVNYVPITSTQPAGSYWGIDQDLSYGSSGTSLLSGSSGIVDTGTTLTMIATDAFEAYEKATGATMDNTTGLLTLSASKFNNLKSLFFTIGGVQYEMTANAQIWPRDQNAQIGGESGKIYLVIADMGQQSGSGLDFINGFTFLQRFYSVFDTTNAQVGLATTQFTDAETN
ncbi:acid protease [Amylostereum chailletii]|nr:acid protease [Amylostereum chailletii]